MSLSDHGHTLRLLDLVLSKHPFFTATSRMAQATKLHFLSVFMVVAGCDYGVLYILGNISGCSHSGKPYTDASSEPY